MNLQQTCDPDRLDAFARGELSEQQESDLTAHLDECASCGEELERRVAAADQWREASELLTHHRTRQSNVVDRAKDFSTNGSCAASTTFAEQMDQVVGMLAPTDDPEMIGRIGGYEVSGVIGYGGMGVVFKAHDRSLDRVVAIKVMAPHLAGSGAARKRFARESKAAAAVLHPNVIAIHCVADDPKLPYLVMPYIGGASLQKRVEADGPLCTQDTLRIGQQIAAGLAAAHAQGLVHRDIKPANILLERGVERVTITDFGLAHAVDDATMTRSGVIAGTPQYMSPEQARGETIDHRSDLFSLGSVLYMMSAGHSPFRAETTFGILRRITDNQPRPLREINPDVPEWLCAIIEKLHAKEASERFQSAEEVAELLEDCLAHVQQPATTPLPVGVQALAAQSQSSSTASVQPNRLKAIHQRIPPLVKYIAATAGGFALFFAGILIVLELGKGTLTIESELDDVPIRIMQGDEVAKSMTLTKGETSVRIASGTYVVEIDGEFHGIEVVDGQVTLGRHGEVVVRILQDVDELHGHDTDVHGTNEDHQYLVWEGDGRVRLSHWFAKAVRADDETLKSINQLLSETWTKYIEVESQHITYSLNSGRLIADVSEFSDARQQLESDFWTRLDEIVSGEQRALLHAISTARGDANGDDTWSYRPKALPSVIGWHEKRFPVRVELWTKGTWFHWRVSEGKYTSSGDGQKLPAELQHYWTSGNREFGDQSPSRPVRTSDALVTIRFSGTIDGASISSSGIGWMVNDAGHILVPSHVVPECNDEAIKLRYASGAHCSASRLKTLGHLTLLKSDQVVKGPVISLNSVTSLTSGDSVSAILNGTDNIPGSISSARTTILLSELEGVKINPELRFQNIITTDLVAGDTTLSGAPLLTKGGDVAGMMIRIGTETLIAIPVAEILTFLEQLTAKDSAVTLPPMEFDTLEDFLKPGRELFSNQMTPIDERLATVMKGSAEHSLLTTKKKQLQQQWDLSVAQVKGMAAAAKAGKPVQLAPIVIPNNSKSWQAPMPDPLSGHDEDIAKVLAGTWQVNRYVEDGKEPPFPIEGATVTFSKNMIVMHLQSGDKQAEIQQMYRIGDAKIDIWNYVAEPKMNDSHPYLGSYSIENDTLRICYHDSEMDLETPQSRPPVLPGKRLIYLELQRKVVGLADKVSGAKGKTDDLRTGQSYQISLLVLASDDLKPVAGATVDVTLIVDDNGVTGDGGSAPFLTNEEGIAIVDEVLWPGRYQIQARAPKDSRYRDTEFSKEESILVVHEDGRYSPREFRRAVDENKSPK